MKVAFIFILALALALPALQADAGNANLIAPVSKYVGADSVLASYYGHFVERYHRLYRDNDETFRSFCRILRTSDLLADELIHAGVPTDQIYAMLLSLEQIDLRTDRKDKTRRFMLAIDFALESIEASLGRSHRTEFRREVLAQVPPLSQTG